MSRDPSTMTSREIEDEITDLSAQLRLSLKRYRLGPLSLMIGWRDGWPVCGLLRIGSRKWDL